LKQLAADTGETAHLAVREGRMAVFIGHENARNQIIVYCGAAELKRSSGPRLLKFIQPIRSRPSLNLPKPALSSNSGIMRSIKAIRVV
jgi:hypothetical protein